MSDAAAAVYRADDEKHLWPIAGYQGQMAAGLDDGVAALPAFAALDTHAVLDGARAGASIQLDDRYFRGQVAAMETVDGVAVPERRADIATQSRAVYEEITVDFDSLTESALREASGKLRRVLTQLPEVQYLQHNFPETCFVVPEWLRTGGVVNYGARVYFFRDDSAPDPADVVERNIEATLADDNDAFARYHGQVHGYPECCVEFFATHDRTGDDAPELAAIEPIEEFVGSDDGRGQDEGDAGGEARIESIEDLVDGVFETPDVYGFFAREFFPEPGCQRARKEGLAVYESLTDAVPDALVRDFFRVNVAWSYRMAASMRDSADGRSRPDPGTLGREGRLFSLPLGSITALPRYSEG